MVTLFQDMSKKHVVVTVEVNDDLCGPLCPHLGFKVLTYESPVAAHCKLFNVTMYGLKPSKRCEQCMNAERYFNEK